MLIQIWLFVIATVVAVIGIVFQFKRLMADVSSKLDNREEVTTQSIQKENSRFFIRVVMVETIPIILVVIGFIMMESIQGTLVLWDVLPALVIVVITFIAGMINLVIARNHALAGRDVTVQTQAAVTTMTFVGVSLIAALPIISIVAMFTLIA
ncbi:hypothetical protein N0O92_13685 [Alkalihalobacillus sp. MEB130]|uniref:hypothetical protein n=1 Tax=Alkalihalobacillus sp. MEB130 TaxID=2976704 RepID=UPI0028DEEA32|nr:hypothetical protein [Alkalihalobacillus sp. MEB130]MDT8861286.1 hypothetical protein [Alkalihalobacillus sp. MEB130]